MKPHGPQSAQLAYSYLNIFLKRTYVEIYRILFRIFREREMKIIKKATFDVSHDVLNYYKNLLLLLISRFCMCVHVSGRRRKLSKIIFICFEVEQFAKQFFPEKTRKCEEIYFSMCWFKGFFFLLSRHGIVRKLFFDEKIIKKKLNSKGVECNFYAFLN